LPASAPAPAAAAPFAALLSPDVAAAADAYGLARAPRAAALPVLEALWADGYRLDASHFSPSTAAALSSPARRALLRPPSGAGGASAKA
jgi:hypothetical protein